MKAIIAGYKVDCTKEEFFWLIHERPPLPTPAAAIHHPWAQIADTAGVLKPVKVVSGRKRNTQARAVFERLYSGDTTAACIAQQLKLTTKQVSSSLQLLRRRGEAKRKGKGWELTIRGLFQV